VIAPGSQVTIGYRAPVGRRSGAGLHLIRLPEAQRREVARCAVKPTTAF